MPSWLAGAVATTAAHDVATLLKGRDPSPRIGMMGGGDNRALSPSDLLLHSSRCTIVPPFVVALLFAPWNSWVVYGI